MGQSTSISEAKDDYALYTQAQLESLFMSSVLKQFSALELHYLRLNLVPDFNQENMAECCKQPVSVDELNKFLNISQECNSYDLFYKFLKQLGKFPFINIMPVSVEFSNELSQSMIDLSKVSKLDYKYFSFGEVLKVLVLLTNKRVNLLGKHYDLNKLVFYTLAVVGFLDGLDQCFKPAEVVEKPKPGESSTKVVKDCSSYLSQEYSEKTGDLVTKYAISKTQNFSWHSYALITSYHLVDMSCYKVSSTILLNFFTLLLIVQSSIIEAIYIPIKSTQSNTPSGAHAKLVQSIKESSSSIESINGKIESNLREHSGKDYNLFKKNAFNLIRSINHKRSAKDLLNKTSDGFTFEEVDFFLKRSAPFFLDNLNNLFLTIMFKKVEASKSSVDFGYTKLVNSQTLAQLATFLSTRSADSEVDQSKDYMNCEFNLNNCRSLYVGSKYGFSMKSFEHKVFNWNAPSLLLISGKKIINETKYCGKNKKFANFNAKFPKLTASTSSSTELQEGNDAKFLGDFVTYGVYINKPWRKTNKNYFGDEKTLMFQLSGKHALFKPTKVSLNPENSMLAYFNTEGGGLSFGSTQPKIKNNDLVRYLPGNVSLTVDANLEFGVFRHLGIGGVYKCGSIFPKKDDEIVYEDKFVINEIEVWGIGNDEVFRQQLAHWQWEEREAEKRNRVNIQSLGEERAFLEMAGLVGGSASGGSM